MKDESSWDNLLVKDEFYTIEDSRAGPVINFNGRNPSTYKLRLFTLAQLNPDELENKLKNSYHAILMELDSRKISIESFSNSIKKAYEESDLRFQKLIDKLYN